MARQIDVQYIRFYTDGSAARQIAPKQPAKPKTAAPKTQKIKRRVVRVDPLAVGGIVLAGVMLVMMLIGCVQLYQVQQESAQMQAYVEYLAQENARLAEEYEAGYDLSEIERSALALGMIPAEQAQTIYLQISQPAAPEPQSPDLWQRMAAFVQDIFA